jgi:DNA polymerase zeta
LVFFICLYSSQKKNLLESEPKFFKLKKGKTCEFARVYGIEFYHVLSRGSQYRVESMMLRIARKLNYIAFSANQKQKATMRAAECIPLTLEPESKFYTDPIAVLDFQSLYPSVIIAFNICFTTCIGRVESVGKDGCYKFGCGSLFMPDSVIKSLDLDKDVYIAPNGVAFVKTHIRKGVLPIMLEDILNTRVMVKNSMKMHKSDSNLLKILDSRQLSLKLIANVTFGYTAANFSGRMPCVEVGDSIVRVARQTLENSIKYINQNYKYVGCRVVYGDTDSLFVLLDKVKKSDAFNISFKIVNEITNMYSKPMKLKFEKIYLPALLLAQKRYIGYMYETADQQEPELDAKGVEIVRRDGCQIAAKMLEKCVKLLFEFRDVCKVRDYLMKQMFKLVNGKINLKGNLKII